LHVKHYIQGFPEGQGLSLVRARLMAAATAELWANPFMANFKRAALRVLALAALSVASTTGAQAANEPPAGGAKPPDLGGQDFPRPPGDPAAIARGKQVFSVNCGFCHGSDARGGEGGPNLLRSPIVLNDQKGEVIAAVVLNGRVEKGMPKFNLPMESVAGARRQFQSEERSGGQCRGRQDLLQRQGPLQRVSLHKQGPGRYRLEIRSQDFAGHHFYGRWNGDARYTVTHGAAANSVDHVADG
jgi:mono/diheme cytochrome c family protein